MESTMRIVGHARLSMDFHPEEDLGVDGGCELIGIRIMPCESKVLNLEELPPKLRALPVTTKAKVKF